MKAVTRQGKSLFGALSVLLSLFIFSGCAHQPLNATDAKVEPQTAQASFGTIQDIKVSGEGDNARIEITTDRPVTYTFYKVSDPLRAVIDLSDIAPGSVASPIDVNAGNFSRITIAKHDLSGGLLTRLEIGLTKDIELSAMKDPENSQKLMLTYNKPVVVDAKPAEQKIAPEATVAVEAAKPSVSAAEPQAPVSAAVSPPPSEQPAVKPDANVETKPDAAAPVKLADAAPDLKPVEVSPAPAVSAALPAIEVKKEEPQPAAPVEKAPEAKLSASGNIANDVNVETKSDAAAPVKLANAAPDLKPVEVSPAPAVSIAPPGIEVKKEEPQPAAPVEKAPEAKLSAPGNIVNAITATKDGLEIAATGEIANFKTFNLDAPPRLVVDIFGAKSAIAGKQTPINSFGFNVARIGVYPEKVRIVLDAPQGVPGYEISKTDTGLKLVITAPAQPAPKATPPAKAALKAKVLSKSPAVESIDFKVENGLSRIQLKLTGECELQGPTRVDQGLSLVLKNCALPRKLQRTLDTSSFPGVVQRVTPYLIKTKRGTDAKVLVKLSQEAEYTVSRDGFNIYLDVKNPDKAESSPLISEVLKTPATTPPPAAKALQSSVEPAKNQADAGKPEQKPGDKKVYTGRKVTLEFSDADVRKIFQLLAEVSNLNFLIGDDVSGTISIKLVNVPWDQALDVILDTKNLGMQRDGNIVQIRPKDKIRTLADEEAAAKKAREKTMELKTEVFDINYAAVGDVAAQFNAIKSERGVITQDARTNKVIVKDVETAIDDMKFLIKTLDVPEKQVMIEARIVEASSNFTRDLGVQWTVSKTDPKASFLGINNVSTTFGGVVSTVLPTTTTGGGQVGMSFGTLASNVQLSMRLSAAATSGQVKIISTPKVATLNNKAAKISQGQSIPYQTTSAEGTKTEFVEAALTLEVTPHITADGSIIMKIKATNNSPGTGTPPPINKKEATTELLVKNGETTVIGGIYVDNDTESDTGVPFLRDIPLLGWLFKSNTKSKTKTELLIFITPRLMS